MVRWTVRQVFGVDVLLDAQLNPTLLEINTNPGFVGRAGEAEVGHFEGLFARLNRLMCDFMWTSVARAPSEDIIILHDATLRDGDGGEGGGGGGGGGDGARAGVDGRSSTASNELALTYPNVPAGDRATSETTVVVTLEHLGLSHYEDLFHVVDDESVMRTVRKGNTWTISELVRCCADSATDWHSQSRLYHHFAIVIAGTGAVGLLLWHRKTEQQRFQLRILVSPRVQGRGVATRALTRSLELLAEMYPRSQQGFGGVEVVEADVHRGNVASARLLRRCGFVPAGRGRFGRIEVDKFTFTFA